MVEFAVEEPGEYVAVNHAFGHAAHGAIAILSATELPSLDPGQR